MKRVIRMGIRKTLLTHGLIVQTVLVFSLLSAEAAVRFPGFLEGLRKHQAPTAYVERALSKLGGVRFQHLPDNVAASYNRLTNQMTLSLDMRGTDNRLKPLVELTPDQVATIYHELWHCYFSRVLQPSDELYREWYRSSRELYSDHQRDFHEEAYAGFITEVIATYVNFRRLMEARDAEGRERMRANVKLEQIYESSFERQIFGYYRSLFGEFVSSGVDLPHSERVLILTRLLEDQIPSEFQNAFSEDRFEKQEVPKDRNGT